jgi:hypothetical protein
VCLLRYELNCEEHLFSYFDPDYSTSVLTVTGFARVYCIIVEGLQRPFALWRSKLEAERKNPAPFSTSSWLLSWPRSWLFSFGGAGRRYFLGWPIQPVVINGHTLPLFWFYVCIFVLWSGILVGICWPTVPEETVPYVLSDSESEMRGCKSSTRLDTADTICLWEAV